MVHMGAYWHKRDIFQNISGWKWIIVWTGNLNCPNKLDNFTQFISWDSLLYNLIYSQPIFSLSWCHPVVLLHSVCVLRQFMIQINILTDTFQLAVTSSRYSPSVPTISVDIHPPNNPARSFFFSLVDVL